MLIVAGNNNTYNYNNNSHNSNSNNNKQNYKENCNELRKRCRRRARALLRRLKPSSKSQQFCPLSRHPFPFSACPHAALHSMLLSFFLSYYIHLYIYIYLGVFVCRHLAKNPFICDCNLRWLADYLHKNPIETSGARCESPKRMHRRRIESLREEKFKCKYAPGRQQQQQQQ